MGVDAVMGFNTAQPLTDGQVLVLARDICEAFGVERFFITRTSNEWRSAEHAISRHDREYYDFDYRVNLWTRYYGEGYERGDYPLIYLVAEWLERRIPGVLVYYGGDSNSTIPLFDRARRLELFEHFARYGHKPYRGAFSSGLSLRDGDPRTPHCDLCDTPFTRYGWGPQYGAYICHGCGDQRATRDGGRTWYRERKRFTIDEEPIAAVSDKPRAAEEGE